MCMTPEKLAKRQWAGQRSGDSNTERQIVGKRPKYVLAKQIKYHLHALLEARCCMETAAESTYLNA